MVLEGSWFAKVWALMGLAFKSVRPPHQFTQLF